MGAAPELATLGAVGTHTDEKLGGRNTLRILTSLTRAPHVLGKRICKPLTPAQSSGYHILLHIGHFSVQIL